MTSSIQQKKQAPEKALPQRGMVLDLRGEIEKNEAGFQDNLLKSISRLTPVQCFGVRTTEALPGFIRRISALGYSVQAWKLEDQDWFYAFMPSFKS